MQHKRGGGGGGRGGGEGGLSSQTGTLTKLVSLIRIVWLDESISKTYSVEFWTSSAESKVVRALPLFSNRLTLLSK